MENDGLGFCLNRVVFFFYVNCIEDMVLIKKVFVLFLWVSPFLLMAQIEEREGLYYQPDKELYNGEYTEYFKNGKVKLKTEIKNGRIEGTTYLYYSTGELSEKRFYIKGKPDSVWVSYYKNGEKSAVAGYRNGLKDGAWKVWDKNLVLRYEMMYKSGKKVGLWKMYDEKGHLINEKEY